MSPNGSYRRDASDSVAIRFVICSDSIQNPNSSVAGIYLRPNVLMELFMFIYLFMCDKKNVGRNDLGKFKAMLDAGFETLMKEFALKFEILKCDLVETLNAKLSIAKCERSGKVNMIQIEKQVGLNNMGEDCSKTCTPKKNFQLSLQTSSGMQSISYQNEWVTVRNKRKRTTSPNLGIITPGATK